MSTSQRYSYTPLAPECMRVLRLHPGLTHAPVVCDVEPQHINGEPYEALSYVWGDPTPVARVRCIDATEEGELGIGKGLARALLAFRLPDQPRRIWIDALCINQEDMAERQSQVSMMGDIYRKAMHVLCWLGPLDDQDEQAMARARLAISFMRKFNEQPHECLREARQHLDAGGDMTAMESPLLKPWLAIKEMFDLEYFHRAWIIQEVGLARQARMFWGAQDISLDWTEVEAFCGFMDGYGALIVSSLQLKSWVANHISRVWATHKPSGEPMFNFVEVLHWARIHRTTDPRDFIYALLSHPSAMVNGSLLIQPNYRITPSQAYTTLAVNVIERTKSVEILAYVDHHKGPGVLKLPTWVPDWSALNLVAPIRYPTSAATETDSSILVTESEKRVILECRGVVVDMVRAMSDMVEPSEILVTTLEKEMQKKTPFLIDHIWRKNVVEPEIPFLSLEEFVASLSLVLTGGYVDDTASLSGETQEIQQSHFAALLLEYERIREHDNSPGFFASLSREEQAHVRTMAAKGTAHQFVEDMIWTSMCRKVFRTAKGHFGLGPRIMNEGDVCAVISGSKFPLVLRRCDEYFELVGPALLYGFMDGEAENLCQNGILLEQRFEII